MTCIVSKRLKVKHELSRLSRSYEVSASSSFVYSKSTFEVFGRQQDRANAGVLDQDTDLLRDGSSVEAHHKQLAQLPVT